VSYILLVAAEPNSKAKLTWNIRRSGIPLVSTGFLLVALFPGAYVSLSNERMDQLAPLQRLQIICAGIWHNFVLVLALWAFVISGINSFVSRSFFHSLGYQSTDERGVLLLHLAKVKKHIRKRSKLALTSIKTLSIIDISFSGNA
jgi:hypothetical protein